jgi:hypothetical protein
MINIMFSGGVLMLKGSPKFDNYKLENKRARIVLAFTVNPTEKDKLFVIKKANILIQSLHEAGEQNEIMEKRDHLMTAWLDLFKEKGDSLEHLLVHGSLTSKNGYWHLTKLPDPFKIDSVGYNWN